MRYFANTHAFFFPKSLLKILSAFVSASYKAKEIILFQTAKYMNL